MRPGEGKRAGTYRSITVENSIGVLLLLNVAGWLGAPACELRETDGSQWRRHATYRGSLVSVPLLQVFDFDERGDGRRGCYDTAGRV